MSCKSIKLWTCSVYLYLILLAVSGLFAGGLTSSMLIQSFSVRYFCNPIQSSIYYLYAPTLLIFASFAFAWNALKRKHTFFIKCFSVLQIALVVLEVIGSIWNFASLQILHETALPIFQKNFMEISGNGTNDIWDIIQRKLKCCGIHGAFDYKTLNILPFSCCDRASSGHYPAFCASLHHTGCLDALVETMAQNLAILSATSAILAFLHVPGIFITWCFACRLRQEKFLNKNVKLQTVKTGEEIILIKGKMRKTDEALAENAVA